MCVQSFSSGGGLLVEGQTERSAFRLSGRSHFDGNHVLSVHCTPWVSATISVALLACPGFPCPVLTFGMTGRQCFTLYVGYSVYPLFRRSMITSPPLTRKAYSSVSTRRASPQFVTRGPRSDLRVRALLGKPGAGAIIPLVLHALLLN